MPATCSDCIFWKTTITPPGPPGMPMQPLPPGMGQCRRNAPIPIPSPPGMMMPPGGVMWPVTQASDSCGQHEGSEA
jgi:hypothetical protein